jgi:hypothetical protein
MCFLLTSVVMTGTPQEKKLAPAVNIARTASHEVRHVIDSICISPGSPVQIEMESCKSKQNNCADRGETAKSLVAQ